MERTLLITGRQSPLVDDLLQEALSRHFSVMATYDPKAGEPELPDGFGDDLIYVEWNRRSPISARSVLLQAENVAGDLEEIFVVYSSEGVSVPFHETQASKIEEVVDGAVKGYLFLLREALSHALRRGGTGVNIVIQDTGGELLPPLEAAVSGSFLTAARALMTFYPEEAVQIRGFQSTSVESREFAKQILDTIRDKGEKAAGRWTKFGGRGGLFPFRK
jgi:NAD(P)-dependent dehydrogenase (short-subunit alcohol dehydrogenase family)